MHVTSKFELSKISAQRGGEAPCRWIMHGAGRSPSRARHGAIAVAIWLFVFPIWTRTLAAAPSANGGQLSVVALRTEYTDGPLGIDVARPRLGWQIQASARATMQRAYEIRVARSDVTIQRGEDLIWDSGRVNSEQSAHVPYGGPALHSRERCFWQVRIWDNYGHESPWSTVAHWEMGLLSSGDWAAQWVHPGTEPGSPETPPLLRREFTLRSNLVSARAYVTSHGVYQLYLNGERIGIAELTPGFTSYSKHLRYQVYDVTAQLHEGRNAVGAMLGDGWYRGRIAGNRNLSGSDLGLLAQIEVRYQDGSTQIVSTDPDWHSSSGPVLMSDIYDGETYDARLEKAGWTHAGYDERGWMSVRVSALDAQVLSASVAPMITRTEEIKPTRIFTSPAGEKIVDFGQNMVGWVRLRVQGPAGTRVTLRHAEILDGQGNLYTDNLRSAKQRVQYTLKGGEMEVYEPHFTYQGFRYVAVDGYPGELNEVSVSGIVVRAALQDTGDFRTSDPLVNRLQQNIVWSQKGNFLSVPTDCPQRDERLGWTGDTQVFSMTAAFNMDVATFFTSWLADLAADQYADGAVPFVVPDVFHFFRYSEKQAADLNSRFPDQEAGGAGGWGDAATVVPWSLYLSYGDTRILETQYVSMVRWVEFERRRAGGEYTWDGVAQWGDWLDLVGSATKTRFGATRLDLIATAYFAHSTDILWRTARMLGRRADASRYQRLRAAVRQAFVHKFVAADGTVGNGTQTSYVLALDFDLLPSKLRPLAARKLVQDVRTHGHLTTGFLGTPGLLDVLSRFGYVADAYSLLNRQEFPSWLYPVTRGATTIWEHWDALKPDGSLQDAATNSLNHYAYGSVGYWMYKFMAGIDIDPALPGYKHLVIAPVPGGGFKYVHASHSTLYGQATSDWRVVGDALEISIEVPPNTYATVRLPGARLSDVTESGGPLSASPGITKPRQYRRSVILTAGSGHYAFRYRRGSLTSQAVN